MRRLLVGMLGFVITMLTSAILMQHGWGTLLRLAVCFCIGVRRRRPCHVAEPSW